MSITPEQDQDGAAVTQPTTPLPDSATQRQAQPAQQTQPTRPLPEAQADAQHPGHQAPPTQAPPAQTAPTRATAPAAEPAYSGQAYAGQAHAEQSYADQSYAGQTHQGHAYAGHAYAGQGYAEQAQPAQAAQIQAEPAAAWTDPQPADSGAEAAHPRGRGGALLAGLAIGALLGGVVGGGVAAVVATNLPGQNLVQNSAGGVLTLDNPESATAISGVAAVATPSVATLEVSTQTTGGSGSGVIYSEDGYIITNAHVVTLDGAAMDQAQIRVKLSDGRIFDGEVVGTAPYADLAVVKIDAEGLTPIKVADSSKLNVGDLTVAIGAPLNLANTVTSGVVSALNRGISVGSALIPQEPGQQDETVPDDDDGNGFPWDFRFETPEEDQGQGQQQQQQTSGGTVSIPVIQTDASINPGNSGGALLNANGELIGINVAIASASGDSDVAGSDGLGFAIPSELATRVADEIIAGEQPSHGLLGANVADSSADTDADANHAGGLLVEVTPGGAAEEAGLRSGDVITAIDGVAAVDGTSVSALVRMHPGGSEVQVEYTRNGKAGEATVKLGTLDW